MSNYLRSILLLTFLFTSTCPNSNAAEVTRASSHTQSKIDRPAIIAKNYTGIVKRVDDIAQQISVRIEAKDGGHGSGVIIARKGDIYYVATAAHAVQEIRRSNGRNVLGEKIATAVMTPTQERIVLGEGDINVFNPDLDIAIIQFRSKQNYRVAEIGNYEFRNLEWVFVSGFAKENTNHSLTIGRVWDREHAPFVVKSPASLEHGLGLLYTNLSLPGMGGGAILDRQGRLVGINIGSENEIVGAEEINFGYSLGVPISSLLQAVDRAKLSTVGLKVSNSPVPASTKGEDAELKQLQLAALVAPSQTATANEWLDYGNLLWRGGDADRAVTAFDNAIRLSPQEKQAVKEQLRLAYFGRGLALRDRQQFSAAIGSFQQVVKIDPNFDHGWQNLALSLQASGRFNEAIGAFDRALTINQTNDKIFVDRGEVFVKLKQYNQAIASFNQAIKINPQNEQAYLNRAYVYLSLRKYDRAIAEFNQGLALNSPSDPRPYIGRGQVYLEIRQYQQAKADLEKARRLLSDRQDSNEYWTVTKLLQQIPS